jgi:hypothetical protein
MSIFDKYSILHGLPKVGQKIKFVEYPTFSFFKNVIEDSKKLVIGQIYTVRKTELNSSSTYVWLEEFPDVSNDGRELPFFMMGSFEWDLPEIDLKDLIGWNARDVGRLSNSYGWGISINGKEWLKGTPMLNVVPDQNDNILEAKFI